jgi:hypothetical protein
MSGFKTHADLPQRHKGDIYSVHVPHLGYSLAPR